MIETHRGYRMEVVDLPAVVPALRDRVKTEGHIPAIQVEVARELFIATIAASRQDRGVVAGLLANARRAMERGNPSWAMKYLTRACIDVRDIGRSVTNG
jgi:hypothetical protein